MSNTFGESAWRGSGFINSGRGTNAHESHMAIMDTDDSGIAAFPAHSIGYLYNDGTCILQLQKSG